MIDAGRNREYQAQEVAGVYLLRGCPVVGPSPKQDADIMDAGFPRDERPEVRPFAGFGLGAAIGRQAEDGGA